MTRDEAIEAIKCNWPDSRYTILREALDMAISALRQQEQSGKNLLRSVQVIKYTCGAGTPEEAETNCTYFIRGECTASFCEYRRKKQTNADRIRAMSDMELAQWMASRIANLKFLDIEMSGKQLTATEKAALTHDLYVVFGRYLQQPAEDDHDERKENENV